MKVCPVIVLLALSSISILPAADALPAAAAPSDAAKIARQSQEFSDASASGNAKVLAKYLDDHVVFVNESGVVSRKKDILAGVSAPAPGTGLKLVQSDLVIELHGPVAVTSFTDNARINVYGQTSRAQFRSTEVWLKEKNGWKMISSQTISLPSDPPSMRLTATVLHQYIGTYELGPKLVVKVEQGSNGLVSATNGGPAQPLLAEAPDVFFTPGQPRIRRIFERDAAGKILGFNARHEGHDLYFKREA